MFVYIIRNTINNKKYVGATTVTSRRYDRINAHFSSLEKGEHENPKLQKDYNKYSKNKFRTKIIDEATNKKELKIKEYKWIEFFDTLNDNFGYNIRYSGENEGYKPETIEKIRQQAIDRIGVSCYQLNDNLEIINSFSCYKNAAKYMKENNKSIEGSIDSVRRNIGRCAKENLKNNNNHKYLDYIWVKEK